MSLIKLSLAGNNSIIPCQRESGKLFPARESLVNYSPPEKEFGKLFPARESLVNYSSPQRVW
jgi:hypothetical protein